MPKRRPSTLVVGTITLAAAALGFLAADPPAPSGAIRAATVSLHNTRLGKVLAAPNGHTLYLFGKDRSGKSACAASCAKVWRPLIDSSKPTAGAGVKALLLGRVKRADGRMQVTYRTHPLYTYGRETGAGQTKGEAVSAFGGKWYAVSAAGSAVVGGTNTTTTTSTTTTTTTETTTTTTTTATAPRPLAGRYCGFTGNGSSICFDVTTGGQFWANGHFGVLGANCSGGTQFDITFDTTGQALINPDLSFNFTAESGDAAGTAVTGTLDTVGNGQGHLHVSDTFDYQGSNYTCQIDTDWTAKLQQ